MQYSPNVLSFTVGVGCTSCSTAVGAASGLLGYSVPAVVLRRRVCFLLALLWTFAIFFLELLDLLNFGLTIMCHDKTRIQIPGSESLNSGEVVNWQKPKLIIGKSQVQQACISCFVLVF